MPLEEGFILFSFVGRQIETHNSSPQCRGFMAEGTGRTLACGFHLHPCSGLCGPLEHWKLYQEASGAPSQGLLPALVEHTHGCEFLHPPSHQHEMKPSRNTKPIPIQSTAPLPRRTTSNAFSGWKIPSPLPLAHPKTSKPEMCLFYFLSVYLPFLFVCMLVCRLLWQAQHVAGNSLWNPGRPQIQDLPSSVPSITRASITCACVALCLDYSLFRPSMWLILSFALCTQEDQELTFVDISLSYASSSRHGYQSEPLNDRQPTIS